MVRRGTVHVHTRAIHDSDPGLRPKNPELAKQGNVIGVLKETLLAAPSPIGTGSARRFAPAIVFRRLAFCGLPVCCNLDGGAATFAARRYRAATICPMADQRPSMVRSVALRSNAFSFEKAFSRLEVRAVRWEEQEACAGSLYQRLGSRPLVAREIVHDDGIAGAELGHEHTVHIGLESGAVVRPR